MATTPDQITAIRDRHTRGKGAVEAWIPLEVVRSLEDVPALLDLLAEQVTATRAVMAERDAARREERLRAEVLAATTSRLRGAEDALDAVRALHREAHAVFSWGGENRGLRYEDPCQDCHGAPGVHPCGCWADSQTEYVCAECHRTQGGGPDASWPCPTIRAITPETTTTEGEDL